MTLPTRKHCRLGQGFTLIELLVVVAMIAVVSALATPSLRTFASNQALKSVTSDLIGAINLAKNTALSTNNHVTIEPVTANDWPSGWRIFIDADANGAWSSGDTLISEKDPLPSGISKETTPISNCTDLGAITYGPDGFLKYINGNFNGGVKLKSDITLNNRCVVIAKSGVARVCGNGAGAPAC